MLIWWTNQADCEAIDTTCPYAEREGELDARFPPYLRSQYSSRYGRNGRGRLWVDEQFGKVRVDPWPQTELGNVLVNTYLSQSYAGIVIRDEDGPLLDEMPGVVTTLGLRRWRGRDNQT